MPRCKKCNSDRVTKSGRANGKQRHYCKDCGCHFTDGDGRTNERVTIKKAMCVVLHILGKTSFRTMARVFNTSPSLTYRWIDEAKCKSYNHDLKGETKQIAFGKLSSFIKSTEAGFDPSKPLTVASGELWPGYPAIVILQQLDDPKAK
ncbi:MAG: hypothetical protein FWE97_03910 [Dehalococcoidia bacterium]|nr:hypothetical protein [Dehalococcoidia bacterium]